MWNVGLIKIVPALGGVAQWIECQPANRGVPGSNPGQGTWLGCRPGPQLGGVQEATNQLKYLLHIDVSLPLFPSL